MAQDEPNIWPNYDGTLRTDALYLLEAYSLLRSLGPIELVEPFKTPLERIVSDVGDDDDACQPAAGVDVDTALIDCDQVKGHISEYGSFRHKEGRLHLDWGKSIPSMADSVGYHWNSRWVISDRVRLAISAPRVSGAEFLPLKVVENTANLPLKERYWLLQSRARNCRRPARVVGAENACPYCGEEPVICPTCGHEMWKCVKCHELTTTSDRKDPKDRRLLHCSFPHRRIFVVDGSRWDGSDVFFIQGRTAVSKRILDKLLSIHAGPFVAEPIAVWTDEMTAEQKERLDEVSQPLRG